MKSLVLVFTISLPTLTMENEPAFNALTRTTSNKSPESDLEQFTLQGKFKHFSISNDKLPDKLILFPHLHENFTPKAKVLHVISSIHIENQVEQKNYLNDVLNGITDNPKQGILFLTGIENAIIAAYKKNAIQTLEVSTQTSLIETPIIHRAIFTKNYEPSSWLSRNPKKFAFFVGLSSICAILGLQLVAHKWFNLKLFE
jgi:hypothetical protein